MSIDAIALGALIGKSIEAVKALLEDMAANNYHWSNERANPYRSIGKYEVDVVMLLASKVDALAQRLDRLGTSPIPSNSSCSSVRRYDVYETCGVQGHTSAEYYNGLSTIEHTMPYIA